MNEIISQKLIALVEGQVYLSIGRNETELDQIKLMHQFDQEFTQLIDASPATFVHIIIDTNGTRRFPPLNETRKIKYPYHPHMGYNVTIGAFRDPLMRFIINLTISISRTRYKDVNTFAEACVFLAAKDPSLPPLHTWNIPSYIDASAS